MLPPMPVIDHWVAAAGIGAQASVQSVTPAKSGIATTAVVDPIHPGVAVVRTVRGAPDGVPDVWMYRRATDLVYSSGNPNVAWSRL